MQHLKQQWKQEMLFIITNAPIIEYKGIFTKIIKFMKNGNLHNIEFPSYIIIHNANISYLLYYVDGKPYDPMFRPWVNSGRRKVNIISRTYPHYSGYYPISSSIMYEGYTRGGGTIFYNEYGKII